MKLLCSLLAATALTLPVTSAFATVPASDNAGNYTGVSDYRNLNRGTGYASTGFVASTASNTATQGTLLGASGHIDTGGLAFGLYATGGDAIYVDRAFGSGADVLSTGQTFMVQLQNGALAAGSSMSLALRPAQTTAPGFSFGYTGGSADYTYSISAGSFGQTTARTIDTGVPITTNGLTLAFTQNASSFTLAITPLGGATKVLTDTDISGVFAFRVIDNNAGNLYFNNLTVVPEPGSWAILTVGFLGGGCFFLRCRVV